MCPVVRGVNTQNPDIREDSVRQARDTPCDASSHAGESRFGLIPGLAHSWPATNGRWWVRIPLGVPQPSGNGNG